jgi:hypothetical protein
VESVDRDTRTAIVAIAFAGLAAGCGGNDLTGPVNSRNNGGVGNQTLLVRADVQLDPEPGGFLTSFDVEVRDRDGQPVSGADVTIEWNNAPLRLLEVDSTGDYAAELSGSGSGTLRLTVEKDSMYVRGVALGNIGIHAIVEPQANDTVPADVSLPIHWVSDTEAPFASLSTRDEEFEVLDKGAFVVPDSMNPARSSQWIELTRYNEVLLAGALMGSYFRMEVETRVEPVRVIDQP